MQIIPAIDLKDGKIVRLTQGDFGKAEEYALDPVQTAKNFAESKAKWIHVVDLYGALEGHFKPENLKILKKISDEVKKYGTSVQFGGGVRSMTDIKTLIDNGASRVIIGTLSQENLNFLKEVVKKYGDKIAVSLDTRNNIIYRRGWSVSSKFEMGVFLENLEEAGVKLIIYTNISKDGMLEGPDLEGIKNIMSLTKIPIIASGGVSSLEDITILKEMGVQGVIIGKAIYKGKIDLRKAIELC
ncbi:MAG: 1-(5-phosphoribosyl)-5-[(5-phosphoribosylamino)methylideneamino]imidazole-4-carboxamide isomerase [Candidatus Omnitrophica bacterium]|nr:1-(5-phosphoribosyl)-5-[(5-phosphoribosylamino)methylideneamino]imidazole-4-carboxamide isomerase [Candidatus Omnitrophota bacterium]